MTSVPRRRRLSSAALITWTRERPRSLTPGPVGLATLVARTQASRSALIARPVISSDRPSV